MILATRVREGHRPIYGRVALGRSAASGGSDAREHETGGPFAERVLDGERVHGWYGARRQPSIRLTSVCLCERVDHAESRQPNGSGPSRARLLRRVEGALSRTD